MFKSPRGLAVDSKNGLYVADYGNNMVRRIDLATGNIGVVGSNANPPFNKPIDVAVDFQDDLYIVDQGNNLLRIIYSSDCSGCSGCVSLVGTVVVFHSWVQ